MPTTAVTDLLKQLVQGILRNPAEAEAYAQNPTDYLAAHGVTDHDLSGLDMRAVVCEAAEEVDLPAPAKALIEDYGRAPAKEAPPAREPGDGAPGAAPARETGDGPPATPPPAREPEYEKDPGYETKPAYDKEPAYDRDAGYDAPGKAVEPPPVDPPAAQPPLQMIEQHISYATYVTYEHNTSYENHQNIVQNLIDNRTYIDNSSNVSVDVGGDLTGDVNLSNEVTNVNATGDGAVAAGEDIRDAAVNTGSGNATNTGDIDARDSAVAIGGDATNVQDRSVNETNIDQSVNIDRSFNEGSIVDNSGIAAQIDDSFNRNDNSVTDNSTNIDVDVNLGGRSSSGESGDPGFGSGAPEPGPGREPADQATQPTQPTYEEAYEEKYGERPPEGDPGREAYEAPAAAVYAGDPVGDLGLREQPVEIPTEPPASMPSDDMDMMD